MGAVTTQTLIVLQLLFNRHANISWDTLQEMEDLEACAKLRVAVKQGNLPRVDEALKLAGVNPNVKTSRDITSHTPLTQAVELDRPDIIKLILKHPACNPNLPGIDGFTPLTLAVTKGSPTIVSLLLAWPGVD